MIQSINRAESYGEGKERLRVMTLLALYVERNSTILSKKGRVLAYI